MGSNSARDNARDSSVGVYFSSWEFCGKNLTVRYLTYLGNHHMIEPLVGMFE